MKKRIASLVLSLVMLFSIFSVVSADANEPEVKFEPQLVNEYYNNEGYLVSEFSDLPDNFVTDSEGNILKENAPTLRSGCALRYSYKTIKTEKNKKIISSYLTIQDLKNGIKLMGIILVLKIQIIQLD
ncbi:hypothetical protein [Brochothrix campestris]|uniref:Uncharacterized protein n=1 Tax=Brochothrix campestris FSL F6-1037 TaxID=1265861 RepID=W7CRN4_9LIST|nr:hypothetical protein [Brochothrix campestris]EUJ35658.1 hypothetical protein BCAMP_11565 [Brochothrix campestris FSL F6-1037]